MTNTYYNPTGAPATQTRGLSVVLREELNAIEDGFDELETAFTTNGIAFPATQVPSAGANTLDDYEEGLPAGSWTPVLAATGIVLTNTSGQYVKIGRLVFVQCRFTCPANTNSYIPDAYLSGLPFTAYGIGSFVVGSIEGGPSVYRRSATIGGTGFQITRPGATRVTPAELSGLTYRISGCYIASA